MNRILTILSLLLSLSASAYGQGKTFVSERVYVSARNAEVFPGDTLHVQGQLLSTDYSDFYPYSRYIYVEMADGTDSVVVRQKVRCSAYGAFRAALPLDGNMRKGVYRMRGYTTFMRNRNTPNFPTVPVYVGVRPRTDGDVRDISAMVFPEGGRLVDDAMQSVGLFAFDDNGRPIRAEYSVVAQTGDTVCVGRTSLSGLATFAFAPQHGAKYTVALRCGTASRLLAMPESDGGIGLKAVASRGRLVCSVLGSGGTAVNDADGCRILAYHSDFGLNELSVKNHAAVADIAGCKPGVLTVWLTDANLRPLAQRVLWTGAYDADGGKVAITADGKPGGSVGISLADTAGIRNVMVRIVPEWQTDAPTAFQMLCFGGELSSPVPFPSADNGGDMRRDLSAWLLSARQTMLGPDFIKADTVAYPYPVEAALSISGMITDGKKPLQEGSVQVFNPLTGGGATAPTDADGRFEAMVDDYTDGARLFVQAYNAKGKTGEYGYKIDTPCYPKFITADAHSAAQAALPQRLSVVGAPVDTVGRHSIGEVEVKRKRPYMGANAERFRTRNPQNYIDRKALARPNMQSVRDAVLSTGKVLLADNGENLKWKVPVMTSLKSESPSLELNPILRQRRAQDAQYETKQNVVSEIIMVVDGMRIAHDISSVLGMSTTYVEHIELVSPRDSRCQMYDAAFGYVDIKTLRTLPLSQLSSNGCSIQPPGISVAPVADEELRLPMQMGTYRIIVDTVSDDRRVGSYVKTIRVGD